MADSRYLLYPSFLIMFVFPPPVEVSAIVVICRQTVRVEGGEGMYLRAGVCWLAVDLWPKGHALSAF